jgi:hypothetical protein
MNNYLLFIPGNSTDDKIVFVFICLFALAFIVFLFGEIRWLFKKDSYWYYWRYWNPFTFVFYKRYTTPWFGRFAFSIPLLYGAFNKFSSRNEDIYGTGNSIGTALLFLCCAVVWYGWITNMIASEDGAESHIKIREAKRHYGKLEADEESTKEKPSKANESVADELIKLNELKEKGLLTEEEFNEQKKKLLKQ